MSENHKQEKGYTSLESESRSEQRENHKTWKIRAHEAADIPSCGSLHAIVLLMYTHLQTVGDDIAGRWK